MLSKILRGKKTISKKMMLELAGVLKLSNEVRSQFLSQENGVTSSLNKHRDLQEQFELISDWYYMAILELARLKHFKPDPKWIANTLGLGVSEVNIAIDRLSRHGLIRVLKNGKWQILSPDNDWSNSKLSTMARREYQRQILGKALAAVQEVDYGYRHNTSTTIAVDANRLPEFKELLNKYRNEVENFAQNQKKLSFTDVYQLCIAYYPLTNLENKRRKGL